MNFAKFGELSLYYNLLLLSSKHPINIQARSKAIDFFGFSVGNGLISYEEIRNYAQDYGFPKKHISNLLNEIISSKWNMKL